MSVLILRALGIGDLATAVPALRALDRQFGAEPLQVAVPDWLAPLVALAGPRLRPIPTKGFDLPSIRPPTLAVNLHGRGPESHQALQRLQPRRLMAFACPAAGFPVGPPWRRPDGQPEHEVRRWCRMLAWYGIRSEPADLALERPVRPAAFPEATLIHPGAKAPERRWPVTRYAAVARALKAEGHFVVVTGSASERELAESVANAADIPAARVLAGRTDVADLAALVAHARLVISGDTGIAHLATGYGTPSVTLFGPMSPKLWGPPPDRPQHRALWPGGITPRTGQPRGCHPRLARISASDVLSAATAVMAQAGQPASGLGVS